MRQHKTAIVPAATELGAPSKGFVLVRTEEVVLGDASSLRQHLAVLEHSRAQYMANLQELKIRVANVDEEIAAVRAILDVEDAKLLVDPT